MVPWIQIYNYLYSDVLILTKKIFISNSNYEEINEKLNLKKHYIQPLKSMNK